MHSLNYDCGFGLVKILKRVWKCITMEDWIPAHGAILFNKESKLSMRPSKLLPKVNCFIFKNKSGENKERCIAGDLFKFDICLLVSTLIYSNVFECCFKFIMTDVEKKFVEEVSSIRNFKSHRAVDGTFDNQQFGSRVSTVRSLLLQVTADDDFEFGSLKEWEEAENADRLLAEAKLAAVNGKFSINYQAHVSAFLSETDARDARVAFEKKVNEELEKVRSREEGWSIAGSLLCINTPSFCA